MTDYIYLTGTADYVRNTNLDNYGNYSIGRFYLDAESLAKFKEIKRSGVKTEIKETEDGKSYVSLKRPHTKTSQAGKEMIFGPPKTFKPDGVTPEDNMIGNGSTLTAKIAVYPYSFGGKSGKAIRLESIRVDNLVPSTYTPSKYKSEDEREDIF